MLKNVFNFTVQYKAEGIKRGCGDGLSVFHSINCVRGHSLLENKLVFCHSASGKCFVKRFV